MQTVCNRMLGFSGFRHYSFRTIRTNLPSLKALTSGVVSLGYNAHIQALLSSIHLRFNILTNDDHLRCANCIPIARGITDGRYKLGWWSKAHHCA